MKLPKFIIIWNLKSSRNSILRTHSVLKESDSIMQYISANQDSAEFCRKIQKSPAYQLDLVKIGRSLANPEYVAWNPLIDGSQDRHDEGFLNLNFLAWGIASIPALPQFL